MFENISKINVLNFFDIKTDIEKYVSKIKLINNKNLLANTSKFLNEDEFAKVYMTWDMAGLYFHFDVKHPFTKSTYPEVKRGDSIEVFVDTRNLKTQGYLTKFCHHFVFMAEAVQKTKGKEITRFRSDDMHKICNFDVLEVDSKISKTGYLLDVFIPKEALFGYDPSNYKTIGFTYRINRYLEPAQHFSVSSLEHNIERSPHLWASMGLKN